MVARDANLMRQIAPQNSGERGRRQAAIIDSVGAVLAAALARYGIDSDLRAAHFLAQTCHESDGFCTTMEYASGEAYEGRADLGNNQPGDGPRYKGRGLIQLTGRSNYRTYGTVLALDLVGDPALAADPATSLLIACEFWTKNGLNPLADRDDLEAITRRINGGLNGIDDRRARLMRAKVALGLSQPGGAVTARPVLRKGDSGSDVVVLQTALTEQDFAVDDDGRFGPGTETAVMAFQRSRGLTADGVVGVQTWSALGSP
jgi:putative chitinase